MKWTEWLAGKLSPAPPKGYTGAIRELCIAYQELNVRELCFRVCVDMVANAMGRCEIRTFAPVNGKVQETKGKEYYLWNISPNTNQNATAFVHKMVWQLFSKNEALILCQKNRNGEEVFLVADDFQTGRKYPHKQNEYTGVVVDDLQYNKTFRENDVIHLTLNHVDVKPVLDAMSSAYGRMMQAAIKAYTYAKGSRYKVHVSQMAQGEDNWEENFQKRLQNQLKPFLENHNAVLPEFDGYQYAREDAPNASGDSRDIRAMVEDIFDFTARAMMIPAVLVNGSIEGTADANTRFLTYCIDPICDQWQEEMTRKRYGYEDWQKGYSIQVDSSSIIHFDMFSNSANVEKLVGSGVYSINDILRAAGLPKLDEPWADEHYMTLNISTMGQVTRSMEGG